MPFITVEFECVTPMTEEAKKQVVERALLMIRTKKPAFNPYRDQSKNFWVFKYLGLKWVTHGEGHGEGDRVFVREA